MTINIFTQAKEQVTTELLNYCFDSVSLQSVHDQELSKTGVTGIQHTDYANQKLFSTEIALFYFKISIVAVCFCFLSTERSRERVRTGTW